MNVCAGSGQKHKTMNLKGGDDDGIEVDNLTKEQAKRKLRQLHNEKDPPDKSKRDSMLQSTNRYIILGILGALLFLYIVYRATGFLVYKLFGKNFVLRKLGFRKNDT